MEDPLRNGLGKKENTIARRKKALPAQSALQTLVVETLEDDKAQDVAFIDLAGKSNIADLLVIASGTSQRHIGVMANHLQAKLKDHGFKKVSVEGLPHCDWVLIDAGDVVVHLFRPEARKFYGLEKLWSGPAEAGSAKEPHPVEMRV